MANQEDREKKHFEEILKEATPKDPSLKKEKVLNDLDVVFSELQNEKTDWESALGRIIEVWDEATKNPLLNQAIRERVTELREQFQGICRGMRVDFDPLEHGDQVTRTYNPHFWGRRLEELEGKKEELVLNRIEGLRKFFVSLSPKNQTSNDEGGARKVA